MKFLKKYWLVLTIFLLVGCLVLIRTFSRDNFRYDAVKWAVPSATGANTLTEDQLASLGGKLMLINLGNETAINERYKDNLLQIKPESILEKATLAAIRKNKGPVILFSEDSSVSARIWMILSEMGMKNIYILQD